MKAPGLQEQIKKLTEPLERIYKRKVVAIAPSVASEIMEILTNDYAYHNVTGNITTGWFVGIFVRGELVFTLTSRDYLSSNPTRKTLKQGEKYNLPYYWGGKKVGKTPYEGESGRYNYFAYKRAAQYVKNHKIKYKRKNRLVVYVGNATEYSAYKSAVAIKLTQVQMYLANQGFENNLNAEVPF